MTNREQTAWITYNGEIYNAGELRDELAALGHRFASHSDTEVILCGYEAWKEQVFARLRGMFALAIYDLTGEQPKLVLARDPLGIKPLYYVRQPATLLFASECRVLVSSQRVSSELSPAALASYLHFGSVPAPLSIYREIEALQEGHYVVVRTDNDALVVGQPVRYWSLPEATSGPRIPYAEAAARVHHLLLDSVRRHLVSDVPLGAFLSGGIDSGSVVALMREANPAGVIRTCSVVFDEEQYSEHELARQVAKCFETEHVEVPVRPADLDREWDRILRSLDQPSNDGVNTYFISQAARAAKLTVALSGVGGDELFGGYPTFARLGPLVGAARMAAAVPAGQSLFRLALHLSRAGHRGVRLAEWLANGGFDAASVYLGLRGLFSPSAAARLLRDEVAAEAAAGVDLPQLVRQSVSLPNSGDMFAHASRLELSWYLRSQLLRDTDVMSMAHSLEVRVPFVDHEVVGRILTLGFSAARPHPLRKQLLRDAVPAVPAAVRTRTDKQGFTFPFGPWLAGPLHHRLVESVHAAASKLSAYVQPEAFACVLRDFEQGRVHWSQPWALAALCTIVE